MDGLARGVCGADEVTMALSAPLNVIHSGPSLRFEAGEGSPTLCIIHATIYHPRSVLVILDKLWLMLCV